MPVYQPCTGQSQARRYISGLAVAAGNDAGFRAWGSELNYNMLLAGIIQTDDTGQIDWTTAAFPGANNTAAGYTIHRFNDVLQANTPIYFKIEYGRGGSANTPAMWVTVGSGTDGAGTITGPIFARRLMTPNSSVGGDGIIEYPLPTFINVSNGFIGIAWKCDAANAPTSNITLSMWGGLFLMRSTDETGNATQTGMTIIVHNTGGGNSLQQEAARLVGTTANYGPEDCNGVVISQGFADGPNNGDCDIGTGTGGSGRSYQDLIGDYRTAVRVYPIWTMTPKISPLLHVCAVIPSDYPIGCLFYANMKGTGRKRRYIVVGGKASIDIASGFTRACLAMLWE